METPNPYSLTVIAYFGIELNHDEASLVIDALDKTVDLFSMEDGEPGIWANGADGRTQSIFMNEGFSHGVGIQIASSSNISAQDLDAVVRAIRYPKAEHRQCYQEVFADTFADLASTSIHFRVKPTIRLIVQLDRP